MSLTVHGIFIGVKLGNDGSKPQICEFVSDLVIDYLLVLMREKEGETDKDRESQTRRQKQTANPFWPRRKTPLLLLATSNHVTNIVRLCTY